MLMSIKGGSNIENSKATKKKEKTTNVLLKWQKVSSANNMFDISFSILENLFWS